MANEQTSQAAQAERFERACEQLSALMQEPRVAEQLRASASKTDWSAMQVMGHVVEMIPFWLRQCDILIAATDAPPAFGRTAENADRLAGVARGAAGDPQEFLRVLNIEVEQAANDIRLMSASERGKVGIHPKRGEMTVEQIVETFIVAHAEDHLAQVREVLGE